MTPIPKPTLQQAVDALSDRDEYKVVLHFLRDERERLFGDLRQCSDSNDVMKVAGSIATIDELLSVLG
jgi:histidinol-phosphate/aromatic aminotransferase/cobyric acid decarboxylase-like protein